MKKEKKKTEHCLKKKEITWQLCFRCLKFLLKFSAKKGGNKNF